MNVCTTMLMGLLLVMAAPAFAAFQDHYDVRQSYQYVFDERAGVQLQLHNKTHQYALCAVAFHHGIGAELLFLGPLQTVSLDIAAQDNDQNDSDYQSGRNMNCTRYGATEELTASVMKYLVDEMKGITHVRHGYLPKARATGKRLFTEEPQVHIYRNQMQVIRQHGQKVAYDFRLSAMDPKRYYVCSLHSQNLTHNMRLLLPPETTVRYQLIATKQGKNQWNLHCFYYNIDDALSVQHVFQQQ